jgi:clan AA aspartic protease (TIGR02281 family)
MRYIVFLFLFLSQISFSQTVIKMKRLGGVSIVPCKINGLFLQFIFDTGAGDVSISLKEAKLMLQTGLLSKTDILGVANYLDANGDISEGIVINIKEIEIGGMILNNVRASVVKNLNAPLLLGQSAISKLGKIQLDLDNNTLTILNPKSSYQFSSSTFNDKQKKVQLGSQIWMFESLTVTRYKDSSIIPEAKSKADWINFGKKGIGCWMASKSGKGKLYNGFAVKDPRGLAPKGWHIPTKNDWDVVSETYKAEENQLYSLEGLGVLNQFGEFFAKSHFFWSVVELTNTTMSGYGLNNFETRSFGWLKECGMAVVCVKD